MRRLRVPCPIAFYHSRSLTRCIDDRKFFGNRSATKPKPQQSTLAFDRAGAPPKAAKHVVAGKDDTNGETAVVNETDEGLKIEDNEDIKPNVEAQTMAEDQDMVDVEIVPDTAGTAHCSPILTCA